MSQPPLAFQKYYNQVAGIFRNSLDSSEPPHSVGHLHLLPPSFRHLADAAEESQEFSQAASTIAPELKNPARVVSEVFRRSGFYHGVLTEELPENLWGTIEPYLKHREATVLQLLLLDGCKFPMDKFSILDWTVERFTADQISSLGPSKQDSADFYPQEILNSNFYSQWWFLCCPKMVEKPDSSIIYLDRGPLKNHWKPLLALSLFSKRPFTIPIILESEHQWSLRKVRFGVPEIDITYIEPDGPEIEAPHYTWVLSEEGRDRIEKFFHFFNGLGEILENSKRIKRAARRYIRGIFITAEHPFETDDTREDAFLQYFYGMESLLLAKGEQGEISYKIATRCAYLTCLDSNKRAEYFNCVKKLYDNRSKLVHGTKGLNKEFSLDKVRDLFRMVFMVTLRFHAKESSDSKWCEMLRGIHVSSRRQKEALELAHDVFEYCSDLRPIV